MDSLISEAGPRKARKGIHTLCSSEIRLGPLYKAWLWEGDRDVGFSPLSALRLTNPEARLKIRSFIHF